MFKKKLNVMVCAFMLGILISISAAVAYAVTVYSNWGYYGPINGYSYQNQAAISNNYSQIQFDTNVQNQLSGDIPAGYMGAQARLFNSDNQLVDSTSMGYNSEAVHFFGVTRVDNWYSHGYYYSKGITAAYNGNGYTLYYTFQSPNVYF